MRRDLLFGWVCEPATLVCMAALRPEPKMRTPRRQAPCAAALRARTDAGAGPIGYGSGTAVALVPAAQN